MPTIKALFLMLLFSLVSACSLFGVDEEDFDIPESQLYEEAIAGLKESEYQVAIEKLEQLESRYPFGRYSEQAQLELIYAYYRMSRAAQAIAAADRFIRLHPQHDNIDYAYYLRGLTNFEADKSLTDRFLPTDPSQRDPGAARDSFADFATLLNRYPNSQYAPDARKRMLFLKNQLATYEIHVARFYIKRGAFVAAANRGRYVVENYQETPAIPEALSIMVLAYSELGLDDPANNAQEVLNSNFPDYVPDTELTALEKERSLLNTATFGLFDSNADEPAKVRQRPKIKQKSKKQVKDTDDDTSAKKEDEEERSLFSTITFGIFD